MPNSKKKWIPLKGGVCHLRKQPQIQCCFWIYLSKSVNLQRRGKNESERIFTMCCTEQTAPGYWLESPAPSTAPQLLPMTEGHFGCHTHSEWTNPHGKVNQHTHSLPANYLMGTGQKSFFFNMLISYKPGMRQYDDVWSVLYLCSYFSKKSSICKAKSPAKDPLQPSSHHILRLKREGCFKETE